MYVLTVNRPAGTDQYGVRKTGTTHTVTAVAIGPRGTSAEDVKDQRDQVSSDLDLYLVPGADVAAQDQVADPLPPIYTGTWEVVGAPGDWRYLSGVGAGLVVVLRKVDG